MAEAADLATRTAREHPTDALAQMDLATVLETEGQLEGALEHTARAIELAPDDPEARLQLAVRLFKLRRHAEAVAACRQALRLSPTDPELHLVLAVSLLAQADDSLTADALDHFRMVLKLAPESPDALDRLAWVLATHPNAQFRDGQEAVRLAERACALTGYLNPNLLDTLAAAQAEAGQFPAAITTTERVDKLLATSDNSSAQQRNQRLSECFRAGRPFRQPAAPPKTNETP
jgi:tetratricopeptide (TPR) repeat protein